MMKSLISTTIFLAGVVLLLLGSCLVGPGIASGKEIEIVISQAPGGGYDTYGRIFAKHLADHIAMPITVKNIQGASGLTALRYSMTTARQDGTSINLTISNTIYDGILGTNTFISPDKLHWIGNLNRDSYVFVMQNADQFQSIADALNSSYIPGSISNVSDGAITIRLLNAIGYTKHTPINGYASNPNLLLAFDRKEITAIPAITRSVLSQHTATPLPLLPILFDHTADLSKLLDNASPSDAALIRFIQSRYTLGRAIFAPPDAYPMIVSVLRIAFDRTMEDPDYKSDLKMINFENKPMSGEQVQTAVSNLMHTNRYILDRARPILSGTTE